MSSFRLSRQAKSDLQEIHEHIANDSLLAADRVFDRLFDHFHQLAQHPELGSRRDDLHEGIRAWSVGKYVVLYLPAAGGVDIAHVVHGARDIETLLARRQDDC